MRIIYLMIKYNNNNNKYTKSNQKAILLSLTIS